MIVFLLLSFLWFSGVPVYGAASPSQSINDNALLQSDSRHIKDAGITLPALIKKLLPHWHGWAIEGGVDAWRHEVEKKGNTHSQHRHRDLTSLSEFQRLTQALSDLYQTSLKKARKEGGDFAQNRAKAEREFVRHIRDENNGEYKEYRRWIKVIMLHAAKAFAPEARQVPSRGSMSLGGVQSRIEKYLPEIVTYRETCQDQDVKGSAAQRLAPTNEKSARLYLAKVSPTGNDSGRADRLGQRNRPGESEYAALRRKVQVQSREIHRLTHVNTAVQKENTDLAQKLKTALAQRTKAPMASQQTQTKGSFADVAIKKDSQPLNTVIKVVKDREAQKEVVRLTEALETLKAQYTQKESNLKAQNEEALTGLKKAQTALKTKNDQALDEQKKQHESQMAELQAKHAQELKDEQQKLTAKHKRELDAEKESNLKTQNQNEQEKEQLNKQKEAAVQALDAEKEKLAAKEKKLDAEKEQLNKQKEAAVQALDAEKGKLQKANQALIEKEKTLTEAQTQLTDLKKQHESQMADLQAKHAQELKDEQQKLTEKEKDLNKKLIEQQNQLTAKNKSGQFRCMGYSESDDEDVWGYPMYQEKLKVLNEKHKQELTDAQNQLTAQIDQLAAQKKEHDLALQNANQALTDLQNAHNLAQNQLTAKNQVLQELADDCAPILTHINSMSVNLNAPDSTDEQRLFQSEQLLDDLMHSVESNSDQLQNLNEQGNMSADEWCQYADEWEDPMLTEGTNQDLQTEVGNLRRQISTLEEHVQEQTKEIADYKDWMKRMQESCSAYEEEIGRYKFLYPEYEQTMNNYEQAVTDQNALLIDQNKKLKLREQEIEKHKNATKKFEKTLKKTLEKNKLLNEGNRLLKQGNKDKDKTISEQRAEIEHVRSQIEKKEEEMSDKTFYFQDEKEWWQKEKAAYDEKIASLRKVIESAMKGQITLTEIMENLGNIVHEKDKNIKQLTLDNKFVEKVSLQSQDVNAQNEDLKKENEDLKNQLLGLEKENKDLDEELTQLKGQLGSWETLSEGNDDLYQNNDQLNEVLANTEEQLRDLQKGDQSGAHNSAGTARTDNSDDSVLQFKTHAEYGNSVQGDDASGTQYHTR